MKTLRLLPAIEWHLRHNVEPVLNKKSVSTILLTLHALNVGKIGLDDLIFPGSVITVRMLCQDLKIEVSGV